MNNYVYKQRIESDEFLIAINYDYFYRLMWGLNPDLMMDLENMCDTEELGLECLYAHAVKRLAQDPNPIKMFWVSFAIIHIYQTHLNDEISC